MITTVIFGARSLFAQFVVIAGLVMSVLVLAPEGVVPLVGPSAAAAQPFSECDWETPDPSGLILQTGPAFSQFFTGAEWPGLTGDGTQVVITNSSPLDNPEWDAIFVPGDAEYSLCILGDANGDVYRMSVWWPATGQTEVWELDLDGSSVDDYDPAFVEWVLVDSFCDCDDVDDEAELEQSKQVGEPADCSWRDSQDTAFGSAKFWWHSNSSNPERKNSARQIIPSMWPVDLSAEPFGLPPLSDTAFGAQGVTASDDRDYIQLAFGSRYALCDSFSSWSYSCLLIFTCTDYELTVLLYADTDVTVELAGEYFHPTHMFYMWEGDWRHDRWELTPIDAPLVGDPFDICTWTGEYNSWGETVSCPDVEPDPDPPTPDPPQPVNTNIDPAILFGEDYPLLEDISQCIRTTRPLESRAYSYTLFWQDSDWELVAEVLRTAILDVLNDYSLDGDISDAEIDEYRQTYTDYVFHMGDELVVPTTDDPQSSYFETYRLSATELIDSFRHLQAPLGDYVDGPIDELDLPTLVALVRSHCDNDRHSRFAQVAQEQLDAALAAAPARNEIALERDELLRCESEWVEAIPSAWGDTAVGSSAVEFFRSGPVGAKVAAAEHARGASGWMQQQTRCPDDIQRIDILNGQYEYVGTWTVGGGHGAEADYSIPRNDRDQTAVMVILDQAAWNSQTDVFFSKQTSLQMANYINQNLLSGSGTQMPETLGQDPGVLGVLMRNGEYAGTADQMQTALTAIAEDVAQDMGFPTLIAPAVHSTVGWETEMAMAVASGRRDLNAGPRSAPRVIGTMPAPETFGMTVRVAASELPLSTSQYRESKRRAFNSYHGLYSTLEHETYHLYQTLTFYGQTIVQTPTGYSLMAVVDADAFQSGSPSMFANVGGDLSILHNRHTRNVEFAAYQYAATRASAALMGEASDPYGVCEVALNRPACAGSHPLDAPNSLGVLDPQNPQDGLSPYSAGDYLSWIDPIQG